MEKEPSQIGTYSLAAVGLVKGVYEVFVKEHMTPAALGWATIVSGVVAYEVLCPPGQTLSEGFDRALEHSNVSRAAVFGTVGCISLHLLNIVPEQIDPIHQLTVAARRFRG